MSDKEKKPAPSLPVVLGPIVSGGNVNIASSITIINGVVVKKDDKGEKK